MEAYLLVHFVGDESAPKHEQVYFSVSANGRSWMILYYITPEFTVLHWLNAYGWRYVVGILGNYNC